MKDIKKATGKIIDILIKINDSSIEYVAEKTRIHKLILLFITEGKLEPKEDYVSKICELFHIEEKLFYMFVDYYDSIDYYDDLDRYKLTISYILELTFNNKALTLKDKFSFLDEEETKINEVNYDSFIKSGKSISNDSPF